MTYINDQGCEGINKLVSESLEIYKKWNKQDAKVNEHHNQQFPLPCAAKDQWDRCQEIGKPVSALDITADSYQVITTAQNVKTHMWDFIFLDKYFGLKRAYFKPATDLCDSIPRRAKKRANKVKECKKSIPNYVAISLLYGKHMKYINDWRLSARMGIEAIGHTEKESVYKVFELMNVDNVTPLELFFTNTY